MQCCFSVLVDEMTSTAVWIMCAVLSLCLSAGVRRGGGFGSNDVHASCGMKEAWTVFTNINEVWSPLAPILAYVRDVCPYCKA